MHLTIYSVQLIPSFLACSSADFFNSSSSHRLIWRLSDALTFGIPEAGMGTPRRGVNKNALFYQKYVDPARVHMYLGGSQI